MDQSVAQVGIWARCSRKTSGFIPWGPWLLVRTWGNIWLWTKVLDSLLLVRQNQLSAVGYCRLLCLFDSCHLAQCDSLTYTSKIIFVLSHPCDCLLVLFPVTAAHLKRCSQQSDSSSSVIPLKSLDEVCSCAFYHRRYISEEPLRFMSKGCLVFCNNEKGKRNIVDLCKVLFTELPLYLCTSLLSFKRHNQITALSFIL